MADRITITRDWARHFRQSAAFMPVEPPADIDPLLWEAQRKSMLGMADELDAEANKMEKKNG